MKKNTEMTGEENRLLQEKCLSFFGVVTASLSHEINNVVAIVGQLAGLLDDLLLGAEQGRAIDNGKLRELSEKIAKQVKKGQTIIKRLNRFAHSIDEPVKDFDLRELLEAISTIAERFAFLKGVRLETAFEGESITVRSNPFNLQQAVFICIELALAASRKNEVVTVKLNKEASGASIAVVSAPVTRTEEVVSQLSFLSTLMKQLGGTVEAVCDNDTHSLTLSIPRSVVIEAI